MLFRKYKYVFAIAIVFFVLRILYIDKNLFFGFEQGRDFLKLSEIASGNLTLIGPKTDIDGIFHGALSYYLLFPSYILFGGNPYLVLYSLIAVHAISVFFLFKFAKNEVNARFAYLTIILYAFSYSSIIYGRWISNPNLVPALTIFLLYSLQQAKQKKYLLALAAVLWSTIFHLQVVAALILIIPILYYVLTNKLLNAKNFLLSVVSVLAVMSSYFLFNYRNENILFNSINNYLHSEQRANAEPVKLDEFYNEIRDNIFPENINIAIAFISIVVLVNLWFAVSDKHSRYFLLLFFSAPLLFLAIDTSPLRHLFMLSSLFLSILTANALYRLHLKKYFLVYLLLLGIFLYGNVSTILKRLPESNQNFIYHAQRTYLYDELELLDYIYEDAAGEKFSYDYYTIPYWQPDAWRYLFAWYGGYKYDYTPEPNRTNVYYVLIEPDEGQPMYQKNWYRELTEKSNLLAEFSSGKLKVEKRQEK